MTVQCKAEDCNRSFDSEHGMKIHFGSKHDKIRVVSVRCDNCGDLTHQTSRNKERNDNNFCDNSCYGEWRAESINGENHPRYNKESETCENCGDSIMVQQHKRESNNNHFCDSNCMLEWRRQKSKVTKQDYGENWNQVSSRVRERDGMCLKCGISNKQCKEEYGCQLHVHHIKPLQEFENCENANKMQNLKSLCPSCHMEEEYDGDT